MSQRVDVAVVGAGILGLAFAWEAARRGKSVAVFERDAQAQGASIRNFGMIWPVGQPPGRMYEIALASRERWLELAKDDVCWVNACGSLHAVYEDDENAVIGEFATKSKDHGIACNYLSSAETAQRFPAVQANGLRGALHSTTELAVDPRQAIARIPAWLNRTYGVQFFFNNAVADVASPTLRTAGCATWTAEDIFIASGVDFATLFPDVYAAAGIRKCKLQMLRTVPQPRGWSLGAHLAGGLTLTHYKSFEVCSALPALKQRIAATMPEYVNYGIHVMASQNELGEVIIGDSHEYGDDVSIFDKQRIDDLILNYLKTMVVLPEPRIAARWHGLYAKHPTRPLVVESPQPGVTILAAPGGAGMTLSFGFAKEWWAARENGRPFTLEAT